MKAEQVPIMAQLVKYAERWGEPWPKILESAFYIHGHLCGGMPLGFRAGLYALHQLGVERELNMEKVVFVETSTGHAAGCFADGVQLATGCTFGKGLIERLHYGKWALVLVDRKTLRAVRVSVRPEVVEAAFRSPFIEARKQGIPPTEVSTDISRKLIENLFAKSDEELFTAQPIDRYDLAKETSTFVIHRCSSCGEVVAENRLRLKNNQPVCIPCSGYGA